MLGYNSDQSEVFIAVNLAIVQGDAKGYLCELGENMNAVCFNGFNEEGISSITHIVLISYIRTGTC